MTGTHWAAQVDVIAGYLEQLQDAHALYRQIFDRFVHRHHLRNLLWLWSLDRVHSPLTLPREFGEDQELHVRYPLDGTPVASPFMRLTRTTTAQWAAGSAKTLLVLESATSLPTTSSAPAKILSQQIWSLSRQSTRLTIHELGDAPGGQAKVERTLVYDRI